MLPDDEVGAGVLGVGVESTRGRRGAGVVGALTVRSGTGADRTGRDVVSRRGAGAGVSSSGSRGGAVAAAAGAAGAMTPSDSVTGAEAGADAGVTATGA
jgi:hypothetical protein